MNKKVGIIIGVVAAVLLIGVGGWFLFGKSGGSSGASDGPVVYVESVKTLMGISDSDQGLNQRYAGVVEPQKTVSIQLDSERTVAEIYVKVDDEVREGDPLFRYDNDTLSMDLEQKKLELEKLQNSVETQKDQIAQLQKQAANTYGDTLLQYTLQIQQAESDLKQTEYEIQVKEMEIEKTTKAIDQSIVTAPITGVIRTINENSNNNNYNYGYGSSSDNAFMTIIVKGDYRIKGLINEQNVYQLSAGMSVTIRSRVNENQTWNGTITEVDTANPEQNNNNNMYYYDSSSSDSMLQTSRYPFYVTLDSVEGLMMGQHVYIEMGEEMTYEPAHTEGVWLTEYYLMMDENDPTTAYVYVAKNGKLEKRKVTVGTYDEENWQYEITSGLTQDDKIAYPDESISEGNRVME